VHGREKLDVNPNKGDFGQPVAQKNGGAVGAAVWVEA
jgi:hypothetical protein